MKQFRPLQPFYEDVLEHDAVYSELLIRAQQHNDPMPVGKEKEKVNRRIKEITDRWQKLNRTAKEKHESMTNLYPCVVDYGECTALIEDTIKSGESYLKSFSPSALNVEDSRRQLRDIRVTFITFPLLLF